MSGKADRLDPVRWRGPTRGSIFRLVVVAVLLVTAAATLWARPPTCLPDQAAASGQPVIVTDSHTPVTTQTTIPADSVGVPIRLADPTALSVVKPGNRVDLLRVTPEKDALIAGNVLVLDVTGADDPVTGGLLLALSPTQAEEAVANPGRGFAILIRPG